ncbi:MAG: CopG family transcriptional regulator [Pseudomonadota bacterium]|nr:CopG family transcriptional regulator [Pseudomonadota bacterium]
MSTTTIRLPDDLKARIASAAQRAGVSSHNFILQALAEKTDQEERRAELDALADSRYAQILASGQTIVWEDMRSYLMQRASGQQAARPQAGKSER